MLLVSMGCAIETATPVNPGTVLDLMSTVSTTYSYVKDVQSISSSMGDVFGWSGHDPNEYIASGPYKNKTRFFRGVMKAMMRPTGLTGYYETFTPSIPGIDDPSSYYAIRQKHSWSNVLSDNYDTEDLFNVFTTPLGVQSKYDWYNHNTWPATMIPGRKDPNNNTRRRHKKRKQRKKRRSRS